MRIDKQQVLYYAPLQGETAQRLLPKKYTKDLSTVVLHEQDSIRDNSDAILRVLSLIGGIWQATMIFRLVPKFVRDKVYRIISNNRLKLMGTQTACPLPGPDQSERILS